MHSLASGLEWHDWSKFWVKSGGELESNLSNLGELWPLGGRGVAPLSGHFGAELLEIIAELSLEGTTSSQAGIVKIGRSLDGMTSFSHALQR